MIPRPLIGLHSISLHESVGRIYLHIAMSVDPLVFLIPVKGISLDSLLLYQVPHNHITVGLPGLSSIVILQMTSIVGNYLRLQQTIISISIYGKSFRKKLVRKRIPFVLLHQVSRCAHLYLTFLRLDYKHVPYSLHRNLIQLKLCRLTQFSFT